MSLWLVTGGTGFIGAQVLRAMAAGAARGGDVVATGRRCPAGWDSRAFVPADLEQPSAVARVARLTRPSVVIHAAGKTPPGSAADFDRANLRATLLLLDSLRREQRRIRVVLVGSAAEYGPVAEADLPIREDQPCHPVDPYAWSKLLATDAGLLANRTSLEVVVARVFNPIGPGLPARNALGSFAERLLDPAPGPLVVGDLDTRRDFVDVRDVAQALIALARDAPPGLVYNVGTGVSRRVGDGLDRLLKRSGRDIEIRSNAEDPRLTRGPRDSRADIRRIVESTGWHPAVSWEQSLDDLWESSATSRRRALPLTA